jgi:hypothetical protein
MTDIDRASLKGLFVIELTKRIADLTVQAEAEQTPDLYAAILELEALCALFEGGARPLPN